MSHFLLKFNYGVEIGARLAYLGHFRRTKDKAIAQIAQDEMDHRIQLSRILTCNGQQPSTFINFAFYVIGNFIRLACLVCPLSMLDFVARTMETFAIVNYTYLSKRYPDFEGTLRCMADKELEHKEFFRRKTKDQEMTKTLNMSEVIYELERDRKSGKLAKDIRVGKEWFEASRDTGHLVRILNDGTREIGNFVDGKFVAETKAKLKK